MRSPALVVVVVVAAVHAAACGDGARVQGLDVTLVPTSECTLTGQASRDCEDVAVLAQRSTKGRWYFERSTVDDAVVITTHDGQVLAGLTFQNDATVVDAEGCAGEGGVCAFTRRRFTSTDANNLNCTRFGERVAMGHFGPDDNTRFTGVFSTINGNDEACGTPTVNEVVFAISGAVVDDPVLARAAESP